MIDEALRYVNGSKEKKPKIVIVLHCICGDQPSLNPFPFFLNIQGAQALIEDEVKGQVEEDEAEEGEEEQGRLEETTSAESDNSDEDEEEEEKAKRKQNLGNPEWDRTSLTY